LVKDAGTLARMCRADGTAADRDAEMGSSTVLLLPDNSRDPELIQGLRDAQEKHFARNSRPQASELGT
jgi:hypothetical protein